MATAACMVDIIVGSGLDPLVDRARDAGLFRPHRLWEKGRPDRFRATLNPEDFAAMLNQVVRQFAYGATILKARGFWQGRTEPGAVVRVIATTDGSSGLSCDALAEAATRIGIWLRKTLDQEQVWLLFRSPTGRMSLLKVGADRIPRAVELRRLLAA